MCMSGAIWYGLVVLGLAALGSDGAPQLGQGKELSSQTANDNILPIIIPDTALLRHKRDLKRGTSQSRPYSNYRPLRTMGRYRYPVYRKRSFSPVPAYDFENDGNYLADLDDMQQDQYNKMFSSPYASPIMKKDTAYNIANSPYDLQTMGRLYEVGKRTPQSIPIDVYDLQAMSQLFENGKRSPPASLDSYNDPSFSAREFYNAIDAVRRKKNVLETTENSPSSESMIRRKRDMPLNHITSPSQDADESKNVMNETADNETIKNETSTSSHTGHNGSWLRQKKSAKDDNLDNLLTRKYFETFAQSVGDKKKRMAYAQFTADKRSPGVEEMLSNPTMLKYMQDQLKELEAQVSEQAEEELQNGAGHGQNHLSNIVVRLDALERMREALQQLGRLQESDDEKVQEEDEEGIEDITRHGKQSKHKRSVHEDCPEEERILANCKGVSRRVGDDDGAFWKPCLKHQVCYMCGSSSGISAHECDAVLSSGLEAACSGDVACQGAAGETFDILSNEEHSNRATGHCPTDSCLNLHLQHHR